MTPEEALQELILFFSDGQFIDLLVATAILFVLMFVTWWVYKSLSNKNLFTFLNKHDVFTIERPTFMDHFLHFVRYVILFPLYSFAGFLIFSLALFILVKPEELAIQQNLFFISIALLSTIRVGAYVSESLAEDLAKLVPLSMLGLLITSQSAMSSLGIDTASIKEFFLLIPGVAKYLVFIVLLEVVMRMVNAFVGKSGFEAT